VSSHRVDRLARSVIPSGNRNIAHTNVTTASR
jgi:hypothetical protein